MHLQFQTIPIRKCTNVKKKACTSLGKNMGCMHPGLAFKRGRERVFCWGGFSFWKRELGYNFIFWRRVQLVDAVGETQLYTNAMQELAFRRLLQQQHLQVLAQRLVAKLRKKGGEVRLGWW